MVGASLRSFPSLGIRVPCFFLAFHLSLLFHGWTGADGLSVDAAQGGRPGFAGIQSTARAEAEVTLWAASALDKVPEDVLEFACAKSFLAVRGKSSASPFRRKQDVREKARPSCMKIMKAVEEKYALPKSQASGGFCSELQTTVNRAQDEGQIYGSVSLADLFETAETYGSDMNWHLFCNSWGPKMVSALQNRGPISNKPRMLNLHRVQSSVKKAPAPQEVRTAELVDLIATGAATSQHRNGSVSGTGPATRAVGASLLQEVEVIHPFGAGSGHMEQLSA